MVFDSVGYSLQHRNTSKIPNKILRIIVDASWYLTNDTLHQDLNVPHVRDKKIQTEVC